jgi:molybdopterin adenylyltransferase
MQTGRLLHICTSDKKGIAKHEIPSAKLVVEYGMEGDAHAGDWHRQVSLLSHIDIEFMRARGLMLKPGAFGENLVIDGINTDELGVGSRLRVGDVLLELTQIGKVCHTRCGIYYTTGDCIMPRAGLFARVLKGGELFPGIPVEVLHKVDRSDIQAAVIIISGRYASGNTLDTVGPAVASRLSEKLQARIAWIKAVPGEIKQVAAALMDYCDRKVDLLVTVGGTGISEREVAQVATCTVVDRELLGLADATRAASAPPAANALLSDAVAGMRQQTLIVNLPGCLKDAVERIDAICSSLPQAMQILRDETKPKVKDSERLVALGAA